LSQEGWILDLRQDHAPSRADRPIIENDFVHIPQTASWLAEYLREMTPARTSSSSTGRRPNKLNSAETRARPNRMGQGLAEQNKPG